MIAGPSEITFQPASPLADSSQTRKGGYLYLGPLKSAKNRDLLKELGIDTIITCLPEYMKSVVLHEEPKIGCHAMVPVEDSGRSDLTPFIPSTMELIDKRLRTSNVLVHCDTGLGRSAAVVAMYIMWKEKIPWDRAVNFVTEKRPGVSISDLHTLQGRDMQRRWEIIEDQLSRTTPDHPDSPGDGRPQQLYSPTASRQSNN